MAKLFKTSSFFGILAFFRTGVDFMKNNEVLIVIFLVCVTVLVKEILDQTIISNSFGNYIQSTTPNDFSTAENMIRNILVAFVAMLVMVSYVMTMEEENLNAIPEGVDPEDKFFFFRPFFLPLPFLNLTG